LQSLQWLELFVYLQRYKNQFASQHLTKKSISGKISILAGLPSFDFLCHNQSKKMESKMFFELLGYFKEYYKGVEYLGKTTCEKDREVMGYSGRKVEVISETITLEGKKKIDAGTEVTTIVYPLCGKILKP